MNNRGLLFIPDISGFTEFVHEMEIDHSRLIIQELLELLINANEIDLEISEIEGDAILFYKYGDPPDLAALYQQVEKMFCTFHRSLLAYEQRRYCQCEACRSAIKLSLKVISHYGEFTDYYVQNFKKLIGKDVIVAHQLLKNDIENHEYWLVTPSLIPNDQPSHLAEKMEWQSSTKQTGSGNTPFFYTQLTWLKEELSPEFLPPLDFTGKTRVISVSQKFNTDLITLFHATGNFIYRHRWQDGVKRVEVYNHFLPRVGMRCHLFFENDEQVIYASGYYYKENQIEFSEADENDQSWTYYTLKKIRPQESLLTIELYLSRDIFQTFFFKLFKRNAKKRSYLTSFNNLMELVKVVKVK